MWPLERGFSFTSLIPSTNNFVRMLQHLKYSLHMYNKWWLSPYYCCGVYYILYTIYYILYTTDHCTCSCHPQRSRRVITIIIRFQSLHTSLSHLHINPVQANSLLETLGSEDSHSTEIHKWIIAYGRTYYIKLQRWWSLNEDLYEFDQIILSSISSV